MEAPVGISTVTLEVPSSCACTVAGPAPATSSGGGMPAEAAAASNAAIAELRPPPRSTTRLNGVCTERNSVCRSSLVTTPPVDQPSTCVTKSPTRTPAAATTPAERETSTQRASKSTSSA